MYMYMYMHVYTCTADEGQKPETAVQGFAPFFWYCILDFFMYVHVHVHVVLVLACEFYNIHVIV